MNIKNKKAFSLIEILISVTVLTVVLLGIISGYIGCLKINEMSKSTTIATEDARRIIEQMNSYAVTSINDILNENWTTWAANNGLNTLDSEVITVTYIDKDGTGDPLDDDPLEIQITVSWIDGQRARSLIVGTLITVR
ncbi:MAG: prepilin-type N-terminal cleavage/methylation domain-containing protein [PVC group bacterium]|nr:prepilin-type N-terminal cleavage/methylation domain-containing protein [PVC group bacterium]